MKPIAIVALLLAGCSEEPVDWLSNEDSIVVEKTHAHSWVRVKSCWDGVGHENHKNGIICSSGEWRDPALLPGACRGSCP